MSQIETHDFKSLIKFRLQQRSLNESYVENSIIYDYEAILNRLNSAYNQIVSLQHENEHLKNTNSSSISTKNDETPTRKMFEMQEELSIAVKEKSHMNIQLLECKLLCNHKDKDLRELKESIQALRNEITKLKELLKTSNESINQLENVRKSLSDEVSAHLLAYRALHDKYRELEERDFNLKETIKTLQQELHEIKNKKSSCKQKKDQEEIKKSLMDAVNKSVDLEFDSIGFPLYITSLPGRLRQTLNAHDGEVGCVRFSPSGKYLATSGSDKKIKIWAHSHGMCEYKNTLSGCNGSVIAIDFDAAEKYILGTSTLDSSCRIWSIGDFCMRHSLTGHSRKVVAGRFLADNSRVVTGSMDRTLKLWDTKSESCIKTMLTTSVCHDVVVSSSLGLMISGHFDKKLRMWDHRCNLISEEIVLPDRITGLDISRNGDVLLACLKNNSLQTIDLRMNEVMHTFIAPAFKPGMDLVRPCFSPDSEFVVGGSNDGSIFIWNAKTELLEKTLKGVGRSAIVCVHWCSNSNVLASCERNKRVDLWGD